MSIHFISGLPRSGSTLLSAILQQNPSFRTSVTSPLLPSLLSILNNIGETSDFATFFDENRRRNLLKSFFSSYFEGGLEKFVIFDTNRGWPERLALLNDLYPTSRVICCVRDVNWVIDSCEKFRNESPLKNPLIFGIYGDAKLYSRVDTIMNRDTGFIGAPWSGLREAWFGNFSNMLVFVRYESLVENPERTVTAIYTALGEAHFDHDFERLEYSEAAYDARLGADGLHHVRAKVSIQPRKISLPPDILQRYVTTNFWNDSNMNINGVTVI